MTWQTPEYGCQRVIKGLLRVHGRLPIKTINLGERNLWMSFLVVGNSDEQNPFFLGRDFMRNADLTINLKMIRIWSPDRSKLMKAVNLIITKK